MKKIKLMVAIVALCSVSAGVCASQSNVQAQDGSKEKSAKVLTPAEQLKKNKSDRAEDARQLVIQKKLDLQAAEDAAYQASIDAGQYGFLTGCSLFAQSIASVPSEINKAFWGPVQDNDNFAMQVVKNYSAHVVLAVAAVGTGYVVYQRLMAPKKAKNKVVVE